MLEAHVCLAPDNMLGTRHAQYSQPSFMTNFFEPTCAYCTVGSYASLWGLETSVQMERISRTRGSDKHGFTVSEIPNWPTPILHVFMAD